MIDEPYLPQTDWAANDFMGRGLGPPGNHEQEAELAAQDEVDSWATLDAAAARIGTISPRTLQLLGEQGILDVRPDRSGRLRVSHERAAALKHWARAAQRGEL